MRFALLATTIVALSGIMLGDANVGDAQTPAQVVAHVLEEPGWIGIIPDSTDPLTIRLVAAATPAWIAGLQPGDLITHLNGRTATLDRLYHQRFLVGAAVRVTVARRGRELGSFELEPVENAFALARAREDSVRREAAAYRRELLRTSEVGFETTPARRVALRPDSVSVRPDSARLEYARVQLRNAARPLIIVDGQILDQPPPRAQADTAAARARAQFERLRRDMQSQDSAAQAELTRARALRSNLVVRIGSRTAIAGAEIAELNSDLAAYFDGARGVLVLTSPSQSAAARAGLRPGDVIHAVNGSTITTVQGLVEAVGTARGSIALSVIRQGQPLAVQLRR